MSRSNRFKRKVQGVNVMTTICINPALKPISLRDDLLATSRGRANDGLIASMLSSWLMGRGALPYRLGLTSLKFRQLLRYHFPKARFAQAARMRAGLTPERALEWEDLKRFLLANRAYKCPSEVWLAEIISSGCMGLDHLWQDLGLRNRGELSTLLHTNFPRLARRNTKDMKWKKFIYRELCQTEGIYVCRAPSCDVCKDYDDCFGSEE